jgi:RNA polymerase sigma-70 factor (ECF subfamily)
LEFFLETTRPSLLLRIRDASDDASWQVFHRIYRPVILRFARGRGVGLEDAEDICQQVLAVVHTEISEFQYDRKLGGFKAWLRQLVLNRVNTLFRHRDVRSRGAEALLEQEASKGNGFPSPEESFEKIWLEEHLWHVWSELALDVESRTLKIFHALVFEHQSVLAIAEQFAVTEQNIYAIKWRLSRRIAARLTDLTGEEG